MADHRAEQSINPPCPSKNCPAPRLSAELLLQTWRHHAGQGCHQQPDFQARESLELKALGAIEKQGEESKCEGGQGHGNTSTNELPTTAGQSSCLAHPIERGRDTIIEPLREARASELHPNWRVGSVQAVLVSNCKCVNQKVTTPLPPSTTPSLLFFPVRRSTWTPPQCLSCTSGTLPLAHCLNKTFPKPGQGEWERGNTPWHMT